MKAASVKFTLLFTQTNLQTTPRTHMLSSRGRMVIRPLSSPIHGGTPGSTEVASDGGTPRLQRLRDAPVLLDAVSVKPVDTHGGTPALTGDAAVTLHIADLVQACALQLNLGVRCCICALHFCMRFMCLTCVKIGRGLFVHICGIHACRRFVPCGIHARSDHVLPIGN